MGKGMFREKNGNFQIVSIKYLYLRPPVQMGQLLNLQAGKIIPKHKNLSTSSRELHLNLEKCLLDKGPSQDFIPSFIKYLWNPYYVRCQVV